MDYIEIYKRMQEQDTIFEEEDKLRCYSDGLLEQLHIDEMFSRMEGLTS
jgi:hypothetical protein